MADLLYQIPRRRNQLATDKSLNHWQSLLLQKLNTYREMVLGDVKVGISNDPQRWSRDLERDEQTTLQHWFCLKKTIRYALTIEQTVLNHCGKGRNKRKKSEEWLWQVTFEEVKAAVERELATY